MDDKMAKLMLKLFALSAITGVFASYSRDRPAATPQ